jgi:aminoglycoside phosphotransferase (APT) family kinase protein
MISPSHLPLKATDRYADPNVPDLQNWIERMIPGGKLLRSWPLKGGISAAMTAFEVAWPGDGNHTLILRQVNDPQAAEREFKTLLALQCLRLPAPYPMLLDPPFMITDYIEGGMDFTLASAERIARQMATSLVKIHSADLTRVNLHDLPKLSDRVIDEVKTTKTLPNELMDETRVRNALAAAMPLNQRNPIVLLHGDYWPGNLLWHHGSLAAVIDWEDAAIGDPLADLATTRLDLCWIFGAAAMHTFTTKYLSLNKIDITALPLWDLYAALRFIRLAGDDLPGWSAYFSPYGRPDITPESIFQAYHAFVGSALHLSQ